MTMEQFLVWMDKRDERIFEELFELKKHPIINRKRIKYLVSQFQLNDDIYEMIDFAEQIVAKNPENYN